jgi:CheY-like chemotaxis protein
MKRILVVDDNMMMRKLITGLFSSKEYELSEACNGIEGLIRMQQAPFDLVITDILMPGMEGIELISRIKKEYPGMKIVAISGSKPYYLSLAKKMGTDGIFTKPLNKMAFLHQIHRILNTGS